MDRKRMLVCLLFLLATQLVVASEKVVSEDSNPIDHVFFRAGYNGNAKASLQGQAISPQKEENLQYESSDHTKAVIVGEGTQVQYDLGNGFPYETGTLEIRFKPNFPQTSKQGGRTVLTLRGDADPIMKFHFNPSGVRWLLAGLPIWHGAIKEGKWNHVMLVWNKNEKPEGRIFLYHEGRWAADGKYDSRLKGITALEIGGTHNSEISIDEIMIYNRAFTVSQAKFCSTSFKHRDERLDAVTKEIAKDDGIIAERRTLVKKLEGKVGRLMFVSGSKPRDFSFPEGITATGIRPEDIGKIDLSKFSVIYFPEGAHYPIEKEPEKQKLIVEYVKNGGGYVGSCRGAMFASEIKVLDYKVYYFWVWGLVHVTLRPHVVTDGRSDVATMHFGNGPLMIPGEGCEVLGTFDTNMQLDGKRPAAILTGKCGKGRVVVFAPHPIGGRVNYRRKRIYYSGKWLETERMLVNALLYAAKLVENKKEE